MISDCSSHQDKKIGDPTDIEYLSKISVGSELNPANPVRNKR